MNHAQHAKWRLDEAISAGSSGHLEKGELCASIAQVHATLALAEQQRIANLIALTEAGNIDYLNEMLPDQQNSFIPEYRLRPDITEALELGDPE